MRTREGKGTLTMKPNYTTETRKHGNLQVCKRRDNRIIQLKPKQK